MRVDSSGVRIPTDQERRRHWLEKIGSKQADFLRVDVPSVHPDAALELMVHHLQLAAAYFEPTRDEPRTREELKRLLAAPVAPTHEGPAEHAGLTWFDAITAWHDRVKKEYGE